MAEDKQIRGQYDAEWDAYLDVMLRRFVYSSLAGAVGGFLLFRSPVTRWASVSFGAGVGIGSAYTECCKKYGGSPSKIEAPRIADPTNSLDGQD